MTDTLLKEELVALVHRVFCPAPHERSIGVLVDLPDAAAPDHEAWKVRRRMAVGWVKELQLAAGSSGLVPVLVLYRNVHTNNGDLPATCCTVTGERVLAGDTIPDDGDALEASSPFRQVLASHPLFLAPTQFSATAPLKIAAPELGFRAATMPGFSPGMIPALRLDYGEINRRVNVLKTLLDRSTEARIVFLVDGTGRHELRLDLRYRTAHASGGVLTAAGTAGNLPSGETYIVPYEGERSGEPSRTEGEMPVQFGDAVVVYRIEQNRAVSVLRPQDSDAAQREADRLRAEPAYGNIAELGLGVLDAFGVEPTGEILLDEKLGLHIAFGRSDHFGGQVGPKQFSSPAAVVHIDRVYVPRIQPRVKVRSVDLDLDDGTSLALMRDNAYTYELASSTTAD